MGYQDINSKVIDSWIENGWEWGKPITHEQYLNALKGEYSLFLTPTKAMPKSWIGAIKGKKVLGLASGGAQQMPILKALGADCTVLDYSLKQLESEEKFAKQEGYDIRIVHFDMTKPLPFKNEEFDIIINPVSNCYVEEVKPIFKECARILKKGGLLICGLDNGVNFITNDEIKIENSFPFNPLKNKETMDMLMKDDDGVQFSHTLDEQIGGQLEAGFELTNLYEDTNGFGRLHELHIPSFIATRSIKK